MELKAKDVSIIIVNYNTLSTTRDCIESIIDKTQEVTYEIILVDNASEDGSKEYFENDKRIIYIYHHENLGFGRANNLGLEHAGGRNILFLNPDTKLINNAVKILVAYLDQHPDVGACGGNLFDKSFKPAISFKRIFPGLKDEISNFLFHIPEKVIYNKSWYFNFSDRDIDAAYISGADLMIRHSVLQEVGSFSSDFFMYYEETDLCMRIHRAGYKIKSVPQAQIQHLEGQSFQNSVNTRRIKISEESRNIFYRRNYSKGYHKIANMIYCLTLLFHQAVYSLFQRTAKVETCKFIRNTLSDLNQ